jgi:hypothetical protein
MKERCCMQKPGCCVPHMRATSYWSLKFLPVFCRNPQVLLQKFSSFNLFILNGHGGFSQSGVSYYRRIKGENERRSKAEFSFG